ncbi:MAG: DUF368 domain-containing protein [Clostridia bacterium]
MKNLLYGMIIGIANIIPGVSGGTMAVILNVYDKIISSVSNLKSDFKNSVKFLAPIGIGAVFGIVLFAKIVTFFLNTFETATMLAFSGLIFGSIPMIKNKALESKKSVSGYISFAIALIIMLVMSFSSVSESTTVITSLTVETFIVLFFASVISAGSMIIPGISGSFVMLLLGIYSSILSAVSTLNIPVLIPVGLGCLVGILAFIRLIDFLFKKYHNETYMAILGLMMGSIVTIIPSFIFNLEYFVGLILCVIFAKVSFAFSKK